MYAEVNGVKLFYRTIGSGPPLMLMHGGLGCDHTYFLPWFEQMADQWTLILYDHRGNGRSRPIEWEGITHDTWAADADALRAHLGYETISLLGHSYGGFLGQEYAARYPERLDGLVLLCTAPALDYPDIIQANAEARAKTPDAVAGVEEAFAPDPLARDEDFGNIMKRIGPLYFHNPEEHEEAVNSVMANVQFSAPAWNHCSEHCMPNFNTMAALPNIEVPTLIISGVDDWITPAEQGQRMHDVMPNSDFVVFERSGHFPYIEEEEAFFQTLREWLSARGG